MTTDAQTWEDNLQRLFEKLSELTTIWRDQERPFTDDPGLCLLKITNDTSVGTDETRIALNTSEVTSSPPIEIEPTQVGLRTVTLQVQIETYDQDATQRPMFFLKRIRSRLWRPSTLLAFREIDTSLINTLPITSVGRIIDGRAYSLATMDTRLHTVDVEPDQPFGRIDKIAIQPTVTDDGGNPIAAAPFTIDLPDP